MKNKTLWTRNFTTIILASAIGAIGNVAGSFALSFLVYEETASTFAAALIIALRLIPGVLIPLFIAPMMDRLPRKPFLVACDAIAALLYILAGLWLRNNSFNYIYYLLFSLLFATLGSFDELSYTAIFPKLIPAGMEEKGYSISSMLYPVIKAVMMPVSALLYQSIGVANILIIQGVLCIGVAFFDNRIQIQEEIRPGTSFSVKQWWDDIKEVAAYLKKEKGLMAMTVYSGTTGGFFASYESLLVAFFSTMPGLTVAMYGFFTVVEMLGRTVGGTLLYKVQIPKEKKYGFALFVYLFYDTMDAILLWLPYPLMLINRTVCGFLGIQSATLRYAATQKYIPDAIRARFTAFQSISFLAFSAVLSLAVGAMGEIMDLRLVLTVCSVVCVIACFLTIVRRKSYVEKIYMSEAKSGVDEAVAADTVS